MRLRPESVTDKLRLGAASLVYQVLALAFAGAAALAGIVPAFALLGFGLNAAKVAAGVLSVPRGRPNLKGIGWWETALTAVFVLLAAIGYEFGDDSHD